MQSCFGYKTDPPGCQLPVVCYQHALRKVIGFNAVFKRQFLHLGRPCPMCPYKAPGHSFMGKSADSPAPLIAITSLSYVSVSELDQSALDQNLFYCFMDRQSRIVFIVFVAAMAYHIFSVVFIHFHNFFCSLNRCTHIIQVQL